MNVAIQGLGWVTPLGNDLEGVWNRLIARERGEVKPMLSPQGDKARYYIPIPPKQVELMGRKPRLRRSSAISYFTAAAGLAALDNAGLQMTPELAARTAVILAISSGGVVYSHRFYETIAAQGAHAASPLLFPETVFNAPASHVAALLGVDGTTCTIVGDASAGISALFQAEQVISSGEADYCVVIGAEEADWVLCEAYRKWRLASPLPAMQVHQPHPTGMLLSEGAAALVLGRKGKIKLGPIHAGVPIFRQTDAAGAAQTVCTGLAASGPADLIVSSANGTFIDAAEAGGISGASFASAPVTCPKAAFGEALGASALLQTMIAALALLRQQAPPVPDASLHSTLNLLRKPLLDTPIRRVAVPVIGLNQQAAGVVVSTV